MTKPNGSSPTFSIITPTRNREQLLHQAIESVLRQSFTDWEMVVYNVGDTNIAVPDDPRIRLHRGACKGPAADFQAALSLAVGDIIHPLSDDDRLPAHALQTVHDRWVKDWLVAGTVIARDGYPVAIRGGRHCYLNDTRHGRYMLGGAVYWKRELTDRLGGFNPDFDGAADFDLYLRFIQDQEPTLVPDILYLYRDHDDSDSRRNHERQNDANRRIAERTRTAA